MSIRNNLETLYNEISTINTQVNQESLDIQMIAVSKTITIEKMIQAYEMGIKRFGENRVQELMEKMESFPYQDVEWHMIGHLQRNKVKYIVGKVAMIHSLDNMRLAQEIEKQSEKHNLVTDVLIEVNVGDEPSKFGLKAHEVIDFAKSIQQFKHLRLRGIMTVAPYAENPEEIRPLMRKMYHLFQELISSFPNLKMIDTLSMGMSNDYQIAIEEGANMLRIGSSIFGERQ